MVMTLLPIGDKKQRLMHYLFAWLHNSNLIPPNQQMSAPASNTCTPPAPAARDARFAVQANVQAACHAASMGESACICR